MGVTAEVVDGPALYDQNIEGVREVLEASFGKPHPLVDSLHEEASPDQEINWRLLAAQDIATAEFWFRNHWLDVALIGAIVVTAVRSYA